MTWWQRLKRYLMGDDIVKGINPHIVQYDEAAAMEAKRRDSSSEDIANTALVSMSAEDTAKWLSNPEDNQWLTHSQGEFKRRVLAQQESLRGALYASVDLFIAATRGHSDTTSERLRVLKHQSQQGDTRSTELMMVMVGELINTAFTEVPH